MFNEQSHEDGDRQRGRPVVRMGDPRERRRDDRRRPRRGRGRYHCLGGYIERGDSDKTVDWVTDFEKETGCKVNVKIAGTSDEWSR